MKSRKLADYITGVKTDEPLAQYSTFKIGGPAKYFVEAKNREQIGKAVRASVELGIPHFILGGGSNILVSDKGFDGVVIRIRNVGVTIDGVHLVAESGTPLQQCVQKSMQAGLAGLEHLSGIPGTVGGAVAGNAGTSQKWISDHLTFVHIVSMDGTMQKIPKTQCDFSYRYSRFKYSDKEVVVAAEFDLASAPAAEIKQLARQFILKRGHQPAGDACAGCVFKNPSQKSAGLLIEQAGLKGKKIGGAMVSPDHANFIVNTGAARAEDIVILISYIKQQVRDKFGVQLQEEIKYVGF